MDINGSKDHTFCSDHLSDHLIVVVAAWQDTDIYPLVRCPYTAGVDMQTCTCDNLWIQMAYIRL